MDLVDNPVHDPLEEVPREVESLGSHVIRRRHSAEDDDLVSVSSHGYQRSSGGLRSRRLSCLPSRPRRGWGRQRHRLLNASQLTLYGSQLREIKP